MNDIYTLSIPWKQLGQLNLGSDSAEAGAFKIREVNTPDTENILPLKPFSAKTPKNARKSQNTPSTNPYQNEKQFPLSSLKNANVGKPKFAGNEV